MTTLLPRDHIDAQVLLCGGSLERFVRDHRLSLPVVQRLAQGDYPDDPVALHDIGQAVQLDAASWAELVAAGICRLAISDALATVKGMLWRYLILHRRSLADYAAEHQLPVRALHILLCSGSVSHRIRSSGIPAQLGLAPGHQALFHTPNRTGNQALRELMARSMAEHRLTCATLASDLEIAPRTMSLLARGIVPPVLNPLVVRPLAIRLRVPIETLAHLLALTWRTETCNPCTLKYLVIRHCFRHGIPIDALARKLGATVGQIRHALSGERIPDRRILDALREEMAIEDDEWGRAVYGQEVRRHAASRTCRSLNIRPLHALIADAAAAAGMDYLAWGKHVGISSSVLGHIMRRWKAPRREEVRTALLRALGIDRVAFDASVRRMAEQARPHRLFSLVVARTAVQEHFLRLVRDQRLATADVARAIGIDRKTFERILRQGTADLRPDITEKIRVYLKIDPHTLERRLEALDDERDLEVDDELRLLTMYRQMAVERQQQLLSITGSLLAEPRPPAAAPSLSARTRPTPGG